MAADTCGPCSESALSLGMPPPVPVPEGTRPLRCSFSVRTGNCYQMAGSFILINRDGWSLVHGTIVPRTGTHAGEVYRHGWAERGDVVFEPNSNRFYSRDAFYRVLQARAVNVYTRRQALQRMLDTENYGPWESTTTR